MDYEKNKEALAIVKQMVAGGQIAQDVVEKYFPELAESEDEKIRNELLLDIPKVFPHDKAFKYITWLEKEGGITKLSEEEQNRFAKCVLSNCAMSFINYLDAHKYEGKMCVSNEECEDIENAFHNAMWDRLHRYYCKYIEKQCEQNPVKNIVENGKICVLRCISRQVVTDMNLTILMILQKCFLLMILMK